MRKTFKSISTVAFILAISNNCTAQNCNEFKNDIARLACYDKEKSKASITIKKKNSTKFECGDKYYCSEMKNCAEAKFYLKKCGLKKLDSDGDGIPCEKLCQ